MEVSAAQDCRAVHERLDAGVPQVGYCRSGSGKGRPDYMTRGDEVAPYALRDHIRPVSIR